MPSDEPPTATGPLAGLRVLEVSGLLGEYAGKLLADHGADVILVEPPRGAARRFLGPFLDDEPGPDRSLSFAYYNTNKRSVTLDLAAEQGRAGFLALAAASDVVLDGTGELGHLDGLGLGHDVLAEANPKLVTTIVTPFGADGPLADYESTDLILMAMGGLLGLGGYAEGIPVRAYGDQAWLAAGQFAAVGTMLAALQADSTGQGQVVDVSAQEAVVLAHENAVQWYDLERVVKRRNGGQARQAAVGVYRCRDGHVYLLAKGLGVFWDELVTWLEGEGIEGASSLRDPKWKDDDFNASEPGKAEFAEIFGRLALHRGKAELYEAAKRVRIPLCPINTPADLVASPHLAARDYFVDVEHPASGRTLRMPGAPFQLAGSPIPPPRPAPGLGEHNAELLDSRTGAR
ncbi:MAG TPA: CoA transferase [Pseudonocardiaceae bacterium]|nr:CoA transferase [Pseudonocardiaceae bacterium]